jgi:hypothetical protein
MEGYTNSNQIGKHPTTGEGNPKSIFLPLEEWIKLKYEQMDQFTLNREQEHLNDKPLNRSYQAGIQEGEKFLNLEDILEYTTKNHKVIQWYDKGPEDDPPDERALNSIKSSYGYNFSHEDIWNYYDDICATDANKHRNVCEDIYSHSTFRIGHIV